MAEVLKMPADSADRGPPDDALPAEGAPPPPSPPQPQPEAQKKQDRDFRDERDERDRDVRQRGGNYYDRSPSPPRDRERDFKRRRSPSPPQHRERRRSPPPFKRYKRDVGSFERRGGFRPEGRRYGYDGGYERGMGGVPGFADNRSYGRFMNHSMGRSELEANLGGYADSANTGSTQREGLMSYKQFILELEDDIVPAEAERRYQEYKSEYISTQKRAFFDAHKDEEWLKEKYHPTNLLKVIERRNERAQHVAKDFLLDLQSGSLDLGPSVNASSSNKLGKTSDMKPSDQVDTSDKRRREGRGHDKENNISAAPKAHLVSSQPRRVQVDIQQSLALVRKLDSEKGITDNILCSVDNRSGSDRSSGSMGPIVIIRGLTSVKGLEGIELLDTLITYLWRVHGLDYYGMIETNEAKGFRHVRVDGKGYEDTSKDSADWEKNLDSFWQERLKGQDPLELLTAKEKIKAATVEVLDPYVRKIRDEKYGWKYGCGAKGCTKLFHAAEFVYKHLKLKHPELVMELTSKVREDLYFQNYMNDPKAPGGTPVMQQSLPTDRVQRRRLSLEDRLRDEHGNRRESDWTGSGGERFNRSESSPSRDQLSKAGGLEGGNLDEPIFDSFVGQGLGGVPPPPVLMPVPGAGPLGPFVPAPPEVAMRMLREQGGPSPYEGNGRINRHGPPIGGPTPILATTALGRDSRRMRSYEDLDAPEDEVTVIDYRSL